MNDVIAEYKMVAVQPKGTRIPVLIEVNRPCIKDKTYVCRVAVQGLFGVLPNVESDDSFSSLCLALGLIRRLLSDFQSKGGRLLYAGEGDDVEIDMSAIWDVEDAF